MIVSISGLPEGLGFELRGRALKPADSYRSGKALRNLKLELLFIRELAELELTDHEGLCYVCGEDEEPGRSEFYSKRRHTTNISQPNRCSRSHGSKDVSIHTIVNPCRSLLSSSPVNSRLSRRWTLGKWPSIPSFSRISAWCNSVLVTLRFDPRSLEGVGARGLAPGAPWPKVCARTESGAS